MAKIGNASNIAGAASGAYAPRQTVDINGLKLLPKIDTSQGDTMGNKNSIGDKVSGWYGNLKAAYNKNPDLYNMLGHALGQVAFSIPGGFENSARRHNLITSSYFKNPYLTANLQQPYDYAEYFADFLNNQYLNKKAKLEAEEEKRKKLEEDTEKWYQEYQEQNAPLPQITSGGNVPAGLDAMGKSVGDFINDYKANYPIIYGGYDDTSIA